MKKKISKKIIWAAVPVLAVCVLLGGRAMVSAADRQEAEKKAKAYVPEDAVLQEKETEDGMYKFYYYSQSAGTEYQVEVSRSSGNVREVETELLGGQGSQEASMTEEQVRARVQELFPGAEISGMQLGLDDGLYSYEVYFRADDRYGSLELNAADGTLLESQVKYGTPVVIPADSGSAAADSRYRTEAEIQSQVEASYPGSQMIEVEMDREDGRYVYEVEFFCDGWKYDLELDAQTGEVRKEEKEQTNWRPSETEAGTGGSSESQGTEAGAGGTGGNQAVGGAGETAASDPAGKPEATVPENPASGTTAPETSAPETQGTTAAAPSGSGSSGQPSSSGQTIGEDRARGIALAKAEAGGAQVYQLKLERDDGRLLYEGEMRDDANEYEFEIDAYTGVILKWESEARGNGAQGQGGGGGASQISQEQAREIALARAQAGNARIVEMELEEDDGRLLYEGEMRDDANEYEFEIDAYTGTVVKWEAEELGR